jgi:AcrR family transcriptional regulator
MPRGLSDTARAKMLDAAAQVVLDTGVPGFTVDEVARLSGVAKTTIYRHFPNPKQLLVAALDRVMTAPPTPHTGSLRGDVLAYLEAVRPGFADLNLRTVFFEIFVAAARDPELRELHQALLLARSGPTLAIYEHARDRGELRPDIDYPTLLEVVQGPFVVRALTRPATLADLDLEALTDRILTVLTS